MHVDYIFCFAFPIICRTHSCSNNFLHSSITSEWYRGYGHLRHLLSPIHFATTGCTIKSNTTNSNPLDYHNKPNLYTFPDRSQARVLILGCGNSSFGADMLRDGWSGPIVNVDFSSVVIAAMEKKYGNHFYQHLGSSRVTNKMRFICADVTQPLPYDDASFDLIICKGVLDAILCSDGSKGNALSCIQECHRLMAPGHGILFVVTNGNPDNRLEYLEHRNSLSHYWRGVSVHTAPKQYQQEK